MTDAHDDALSSEPNGRRRAVVMVIGLMAVAILIAVPIWLTLKVDDQGDQLAAQTDKLEELVATQATLIARNKELVDQAEVERQAVAVELCRKTNYALRTNRESIAAAEAALIAVLRMSPHSAAVADQVEASLPPEPAAADVDSDCNGDGQLTADDYAG